MQIKVTFRHFNGQHPVLHQLAIDRANSFTKYHEGIITTDVKFINGTDKTVEFTLFLEGNTITAKDSSEDFQKSLHEASDKIIRQIKKWKTKRFSHV